MHHLKETTIDGVKFVLIPEELHDELARFVYESEYATPVITQWREYDPEVFDGL
jgi:hypothetical protein